MNEWTCPSCKETVQDSHKCDKGKLRWDLFPFDAAEHIVRVLMHGEKAYASHQWRTGGGIGSVRAATAAMRHLAAWFNGRNLDEASGEHHLAHAACELLFALHSIANGKGDTRYVHENHPAIKQAGTFASDAREYYNECVKLGLIKGPLCPSETTLGHP